MELTHEQRLFLDRCRKVEELLKADHFPALTEEANIFSRQWLNASQVQPSDSAYYAGGAKALLDFIDHLADFPRQKEELLKELSNREAAPKGPKPSTRTRQEPSDL